MTAENISSHRNRADTELLTVEKFANELLVICRESKDRKFNKYSMIKIGPNYE
jgi:hypothetical protein